MIKSAIKCTILVALSALAFTACKTDGGGNGKDGKSSSKEVISKRAGINEVAIHELADPDGLNVYTSSSAGATYIQGNIFMGLITQDPQTLEYHPWLAKELPIVTELDDGPMKGGMSFEYTIRDEAKWDDGSPITGHDFVFSMKAIKNPMVECHQLRPYIEFIKRVDIDPSNPKHFTIFSDSRYFMAKAWTGYTIKPEYIYDPNKLMRQFTLAELSSAKETERLKANNDIVKFATEFNSEKFAREADFVIGCGPYSLVNWETGSEIILTKKKNWWGENVTGVGFDNNPDKIIYKIIKDPTTALTAMKDEGIDLMRSIKPSDYVKLRDENDKFKEYFDLHAPAAMTYGYIGLNLKNEILKDKNVRKGLAHCLDVNIIIDKIFYGFGEPSVGPIHPIKTYANKSLKPYEYDIAKAKEYFEKAGWTDSDKDGILDKMINGRLTPLKLTLKHNAESPTRGQIALIYQAAVKKAGVDLDIVTREWTVFLDDSKKHDFDMYLGAWVGGTGLNDFKQIWHTESYNGGSNYVGFGTAETDKLIEEIRFNNDEKSRTEQYLKMQEIIHDEVPYIFMNVGVNRLGFHKRFDEAEAYVSRPGYDEKAWKLNSQFGVASATAN